MLLTVLFLVLGTVYSGAVNGVVRDAKTGEPLAYANVELQGTGLGTVTNASGYYYLSGVEPGSYQLVISYIGFQTFLQPVSVREGQVTTVNAELTPEPVKLGEVKVTATRARFEREAVVSTQRLDTRQLVLLPKLGGEVDIIRSVQLLPGVITVSDFSNKLYIRGGSPDQNLILLDGITVYNPSHLFGVFSPFVPEAVSDVQLLAGGFPAKYGSRLSSVLDVTTREGNSRSYSGEGSVSVIAAKGIAEGPIPRGSFLFAGRRTYLPDLLLKTFGVPGLNYYFYDLMGKVNYHMNPDHRLTLAGLGAEDVLSFWDPAQPDAFRSRLTWGNRGAALRLTSIWTPVLYGDLLVAWSNFFSDFLVKFQNANDVRMKGDLTTHQLKADFTCYLHDRHTLGFGVDFQKNGVGLKVQFDTIRFAPRDTLVPLAVYLEDQWELIGRRLMVRPGLRFAWYSKGKRFEPEPRLGTKLFLGKNTAWNTALGRYTQPLITLNSTEAIFSIYDVWVPVRANRKLPTAWHYITGVEHWVRDDLTLQIEAYYKDYRHLLETRYGEIFTPPDSLLDARGYSLGAELLVKKTVGPINGWLAYSWMWTRREAGGEVYYPHYDRRHSLNLVLNFPAVLLGYDFSLRWTLGTGLPYAGIAGFYYRIIERPGGPAERQLELIYSDRDAFRYPAYHRLDVSLSRTGRLGRIEASVFLDIINLYNARNVLLYYWEAAADGKPVRHQVTMLPVLPTLGIRMKF